MRVLITLLPATGSLHPLVPLAGALADAGHEIAFSSSAGFRPCVEGVGFTHVDAGLDFVFSEPGYLEILAAAAGGVALAPPAGVDRLAWVTDKLFIGGAARRMLPDVQTAAREWGADLVLRESLEFAGCVAAEALGLPHASVAAPSNGGLDLRDQLVAPQHPAWRRRPPAGSALRDALPAPAPGLYPSAFRRARGDVPVDDTLRPAHRCR